MLQIARGSNNTIILTLNESKTLTNPYYLMKMVSSDSRTVKTFILASDLSGHTDRFNKFVITESATEVLTSGTVTLKPTGIWDWEVYEQTSSTNLNVNAADNQVPLESGQAKVTGTVDTIKIYNGQTKEYKYPTTGST